MTLPEENRVEERRWHTGVGFRMRFPLPPEQPLPAAAMAGSWLRTRRPHRSLRQRHLLRRQGHCTGSLAVERRQRLLLGTAHRLLGPVRRRQGQRYLEWFSGGRDRTGGPGLQQQPLWSVDEVVLIFVGCATWEVRGRTSFTFSPVPDSDANRRICAIIATCYNTT